MAIYTGFAIVLTTLIWVYLSWLILLIGAQLAFYVQFPQYLRHGHQISELTGSAAGAARPVRHVFDRPRLSATAIVAGAGSQLAAELDLPGAALDPRARHVCERPGSSSQSRTERFLPARDPRHPRPSPCSRRCAAQPLAA